MKRYSAEELAFDHDVQVLAQQIYDAVDGKIEDILLFHWIGEIHLWLKQDAVHHIISQEKAKEIQKHFWGFYK